ncbi:Mur ligase family protein [soil metagenome]
MTHVHLIGVSGTGMGALAMLFRERGARVTGSDVAFDPPIGPALEEAGIECLRGYDAAHVSAPAAPDLVVVGNAIRKDNPEALAAEALGLRRVSMSGALREEFLGGRRAVVVAGTHGKTTTTSIAAWVLQSAALDPGYFIGGIPKNFPRGAAIGRSQKSLTNARRAPFVIEGDEYDAVYWHKQPKFYDYIGVSDDDLVILTSVEHDHIDIYPDEAAYDAVFRELLRRVPKLGRVFADASQRRVRELLAETAAQARNVSFYALQGDDTGDITPEWLAALGPVDDQGKQIFDVYVGGSSLGRFTLNLPGAHNVKNALACIAVAAEGFAVSTATIRSAIATFEGVRRRQELRGSPGGVLVYDDFAHHPTAVDETLRALRRKHPRGTLFAVFEPRSATACRNLHQTAYVGAFAPADVVLFAPIGRSHVPEAERLDVARLAREIGPKAEAISDVDAIVERLRTSARSGDVVAILSNGAFGGIHEKLLAAFGPEHGPSAQVRETARNR